MSISSAAETYLWEVWGYDDVAEVDDNTFECLKENVRMAEAAGYDWHLDVELVEAIKEYREREPADGAWPGYGNAIADVSHRQTQAMRLKR